jgi:hypothetical protein
MKAAPAFLALFLGLIAPAPSDARTSLGTFDGWGSFRDDMPLRCYAIARPVRSAGGRVRPFASVSHWPQAGVRGQLHIRLSRQVPNGGQISLLVDDRRFALVAGGVDAWAPDAANDAGIIARLRSARSFTVEVKGQFSETYALKGAATAIDAAALGCARR